jgi:lysophospholipase L1-like esterase
MLKRFLLALALAGTLALSATLPAAAEERDHRATELALGDSVAFGFNPLLVRAGLAGNPDNFVGYPEIAAGILDLQDVNASCPGEATGGFISPTGTDNGCRGYRRLFPLHVSYQGTQLAFALSFLRQHHQVRLVTMDIGANDIFVLQHLCTNSQGILDPVCFNNGVPQVLATIHANLEFIFGQIRNVAHYHGRLVTLSYYGLAYDPTSAAATRALNAPIIAATKEFRGVVADGFGAFQPFALAAGGSSCAAGLLIVLPTGGCDVHPSPKGRDLLAQAVVQAATQEEEQD